MSDGERGGVEATAREIVDRWYSEAYVQGNRVSSQWRDSLVAALTVGIGVRRQTGESGITNPGSDSRAESTAALTAAALRAAPTHEN